MAQNWTDDTFAGSHVGQTDLQNMENNFACLKSTFSGTAAPSNPVEGQQWFETDKDGTRVYIDSSWLALLQGDANTKLWHYRNDTCDGWIIDATVTDKVLALEGGSYGTTGGVTSGSWTISGLSQGSHSHTVNSHNHHVYNANSGNDGRTYDSNGNVKTGIGISTNNNADYMDYESNAYDQTGSGMGDMYTNNKSPGTDSKTPAISHTGAWRPAAAVGTLQKPYL